MHLQLLHCPVGPSEWEPSREVAKTHQLTISWRTRLEASGPSHFVSSVLPPLPQQRRTIRNSFAGTTREAGGVWKAPPAHSLKISGVPTKSGAELSGAGSLPRRGQLGAKLEAGAGLDSKGPNPRHFFPSPLPLQAHSALPSPSVPLPIPACVWGR